MSQSLFKITIPEPCHEDWDSMQADARGKFCGACCQSVYDFSDKTPEQIHDILREQSSKSICGYFKESQLNKPLLLQPLYKPATFTARFALALYLVFGSLLFSCKSLPQPEQKQQDGPIFQKGRFLTDDPACSERRIYGAGDYIRYLEPEEKTDTTLQRSE